MSAWLRQLAADATPGPWTAEGEFPLSWDVLDGSGTVLVAGDWDGNAFFTEADARLIALAPQLALLCADMADALEAYIVTDGAEDCVCSKCKETRELLARLDALQPKDTA